MQSDDVAHALARTTLRGVTNVRELEPDVAQALACRGELQFAQRDFSPARSVTCAVVLWKACCGELQFAGAGRKAGLVETTRL